MEFDLLSSESMATLSVNLRLPCTSLDRVAALLLSMGDGRDYSPSLLAAP